MRIDVPAVSIAHISAPRELDDEFVERVIDLAEILPDTNRDWVRLQIRAQARSYLFGEAISQRYLSASDGVVRLTGRGTVSALPVLANSLGLIPGPLLFRLIERPDGRRSLSD